MIDYKTNKMNINSTYGAYGSRNLCQEITLPGFNDNLYYKATTIGVISKIENLVTVIAHEGKTPANKDILGHEFICEEGSLLFDLMIENDPEKLNKVCSYSVKINSGPEKGREFTINGCKVSRSHKSEYYI